MAIAMQNHNPEFSILLTMVIMTVINVGRIEIIWLRSLSSVPEIPIWSILVIKSDLKWCNCWVVVSFHISHAHFAMIFMYIEPVFSDLLSYVTLFLSSLEESHKTGLTVCRYKGCWKVLLCHCEVVRGLLRSVVKALHQTWRLEKSAKRKMTS